MDKLLVTFLLTLTAASYAADTTNIHMEEGLDYIVPAISPVQFKSKGEFTKAFFIGRFALTGTYYYSHVAEAENNEDVEWDGMELYFVPDEKFRGKLPYWKQRGQVHEMWFLNSEQFVAAVVPEAVRTKVQGTVGQSATGRASIIVENYQASVDCDYPGYSVTFVSLSELGYYELAQVPFEHHGC